MLQITEPQWHTLLQHAYETPSKTGVLDIIRGLRDDAVASLLRVSLANEDTFRLLGQAQAYDQLLYLFLKSPEAYEKLQQSRNIQPTGI